MTRPVVLRIDSCQQALNEEPERTRLTTGGTLELDGEAVVLTYEESALTGLEGTTTSFRVEPKRTVLERHGTLESRMVFEPGREDCSLYDMGFGALMIRVRGVEIKSNLGADGGTLEVRYQISRSCRAARRNGSGGGSRSCRRRTATCRSRSTAGPRSLSCRSINS